MKQEVLAPPRLVRLSGASFGYQGRAVVAGVNLEVEAGDFVGIVGPNGAGKTTLFRGMLGLITPLAGRVERGSGAFGYVPQRESLDPIFPLSAEEVVHMGAYGRLAGLRGLSREERELSERSLARVGLLDRAKRPFASLSGGQRQRILIARALMARPTLLLLDEPTSGVDRGAQAQILSLLLELSREERIAVLLVSHQIALVREAAPRVLWVADGRVVEGRASEILAPANLDRLYETAGSPAREIDD